MCVYIYKKYSLKQYIAYYGIYLQKVRNIRYKEIIFIIVWNLMLAQGIKECINFIVHNFYDRWKITIHFKMEHSFSKVVIIRGIWILLLLVNP